MKAKTGKQTTGKQFGPEPLQFDPYAGQTGDEFVAEALAAFEAVTQRQKAISIILPETLLERTRGERSAAAYPARP